MARSPMDWEWYQEQAEADKSPDVTTGDVLELLDKIENLEDSLQAVVNLLRQIDKQLNCRLDFT